MLTWDALVQQWWLQFIVGVAVVGFTAGVAAIFSKTVRQRFWAPIGRGLRWLSTLRLTTTRRQKELTAEADKLRKDAKRFREVCDLLEVWPVLSDSTVVPERIQHLRDAAAAAKAEADKKVAAADARLQREVESTRAIAQKEIRDQLEINEGQVELARSDGRKDGYREAMAEVAAQRAVPLPRPVWRLWATGIGKDLELSNVQADATASDVRIEPVHPNTFAFHSPNQWFGPFEPRTFTGERVSRLDITFDVHYRDANGDWQQGTAVLPREPRQAYVFT